MLLAPVLVAYSAMCLVELGATENFSPPTERSKLSGTSVPARLAPAFVTSNQGASPSAATTLVPPSRYRSDRHVDPYFVRPNLDRLLRGWEARDAF